VSHNNFTLGQLHALLLPAVPAARLVGDPELAILRVHSDTRSLQAGDFFVALRGERFDAHDFLAQARAAGAVAADAAVSAADRAVPAPASVACPRPSREAGCRAMSSVPPRPIGRRRPGSLIR